jgi:hypothetical protein
LSRSNSLPLVVLAAGLSTRYGRLKQLEPLGPSGEAIMDYNVYDAFRAGFRRAVFVVRQEILDDVRSHVDAVFGETLSPEYVLQDLAYLPDGFRAPPERHKPWGTAQAVLMAAERVDGPFAVCNADDQYGPGAFARLHDYLSRDPVPTEGVLVGYPLRETLAGSGGVARAVCHVGREGLLEHVVEVRDIRKKDGWIVGVADEGAPVELSGDELASMNLWGLTPGIVEGMRRRFVDFLRLWGANPTQEFFLSSAINAQIEVGSARVRALRARDPWFGLTHADDQGWTQAMLLERIEAGVYPRDLARGLSAAGAAPCS